MAATTDELAGRDRLDAGRFCFALERRGLAAAWLPKQNVARPITQVAQAKALWRARFSCRNLPVDVGLGFRLSAFGSLVFARIAVNDMPARRLSPYSEYMQFGRYSLRMPYSLDIEYDG